MDFHSLMLGEAASLIARGDVSPVNYVSFLFARIDKLNPELNCFLTITKELALQQAEQAEVVIKEKKRIPLLTGIPIALKDIFETRGIETTAGSLIYKNHIPNQDAYTVQKLYDAGMVLLGKLNMHEIALGVTNNNPHFGPCRNPWNLDRISGGSSGGSACALAAGLCMGSLGSDTGGSIRIPASLCGIVGFKPTYGRVSLRGISPLSWHCDHAGPLARCVRDSAILLQVIAGFDPHDPVSIDQPVPDYAIDLDKGVQGLKIALAGGDYFSQADTEVLKAVHEAAHIFRSLGAQVEEVKFPKAYEAAQANTLMVVSDAAAAYSTQLRDQPQDIGEDVLRRLQIGRDTSLESYIQARRTQAVLRREFELFFQKFNYLLTPTTPVTAPLITGPDAVEQAKLLTRFTAPFNLTGLPAISIPCGFTSMNLPVGLQIVSRPWAEVEILRAAFAYEQSQPWHKTFPDL